MENPYDLDLEESLHLLKSYAATIAARDRQIENLKAIIDILRGVGG